MIEEAIKHVAAEALKKNKAEVFHVDGDPPHIHRIKTVDGKIEKLITEPKVRGEIAGTLDSLVAMAKLYKTEKSAILVNPDGVVFMRDTDAPASDRVSYQFRASIERTFVKTLEGSKGAIGVGPLVDALRYDLVSANIHPELIEGVGKLRTSTHTDQNQGKARTTESLGSSVTTEASAGPDAELPDRDQLLSLRLFANDELDLRFPVRFLLDPDMARQGWVLYPVRESLEAWVEQTLRWIDTKIGDQLADAEIPHFIAKW